MEIANKEIKKYLEWCSMNKLSLNADKTKYIYFHKKRDKDNIPLCLSDLKINNICLIQVNNIFRCLFGRKSKLAKSHSIHLEGNLKKYWILIQSKSYIIKKMPVAALLS